MNKFFALLSIFIVFIGLLIFLFNFDKSTRTIIEPIYPEPTNYAVDIAGVLTGDQLQQLNTLLENIDDGDIQISVAIVETTSPLAIEQYGIKLAEKWKTGYSDSDNGAIVILATGDRKVRIEIGYGLEGVITDAEAGRIIDDAMIPYLKDGDWFNALVAGVTEIKSKHK